MSEIYIGRQPIYDRNLDLFAYELLYRPNNKLNAAGVIDHDLATSQVLLNAFLEFGLERLVGKKRAFINLPRSFVVGDLPLPFPKEQVVLEILEDIEPDAVVIEAVRRLSAEGYEIALDDFIYHSNLRPLISASKIIKIDIINLPRGTVRDHVALLREHNVELLAEKVETHEDFAFAEELGFDYFQGYFFCRPKIVSGKSIPANRLSILHMLAKLQEPDLKITELADLVSQDVAISYKLLRSLNSPFYALSKPIESIHHAIVYVGLQQIKQWVTLIALSSIPGKPLQLMVVAITRAKMCECLAGDNTKSSKSAFTVGLLSVLDALMDTSMENALSKLPLATDIKEALLHSKGTLGHTLQCVLDYEQGRWDEINIPDTSRDTLTQAYLKAVTWADQLVQTF